MRQSKAREDFSRCARVAPRLANHLSSLGGLRSFGGFGLLEALFAKDGAAVSVSITGGTYATVFTNFLRDPSCLSTGFLPFNATRPTFPFLHEPFILL